MRPLSPQSSKLFRLASSKPGFCTVGLAVFELGVEPTSLLHHLPLILQPLEDAVQHAIDESRRVLASVKARQPDCFVPHASRRCRRTVQELTTREPQHIAIDYGEALHAPVEGRIRNIRVDGLPSLPGAARKCCRIVMRLLI